MKIFVVNSGSSSLKYQLLDMDNGAVMTTGLVERIGDAMGKVSQKSWPGTEREAEVEREVAFPDHRAAMHTVVDLVTGADTGVIASSAEINAIGHRVVQGGETLFKSTLIDDDVVEKIRENCHLSPLHNPANLVGIEVARELFAGVPQVAVFDTEFHQTMPAEAFMYPIPYELYEELKIRRYGFHGTSHRYVAQQAAAMLGKAEDEVNLVTLHLGNGCSMAAVRGGKCIDTSMGLTPLAGVMMGTRSGDIDPAILPFLMKEKGLSMDEVDSILNKQSGLKGICGMNDMRDIHSAAEKGDKKAALAVDMFVYRIKKYIGAYYAVTGPLDALVFTAGIGENDEIVRARVCANLEHLGISIDSTRNAGRKKVATAVQADGSKVAILVIPTNEELAIAKATLSVLK
ncbi:acetate kinase [Desulfomicrobium macestii]|uniref:Acetate kinase n=2 Tax=Desulfomicrobium TaxID=898 RepID=A0A8G2C5C3_DESNO|nr:MULTISPECIES: acetate kinase [Desulfomicrobium]MBE1424744.1 acetate kinase [Desulfomicrobium macestii]SFM09835.1 acetate kinase [Desulfomicrobium norvegicum]